MGLADLKKNSTPSRTSHNDNQTRQLALDSLLDDFINDANRYALGQKLVTTEQSSIANLDYKPANVQTEKNGLISNKQKAQTEPIPRVKRGCTPVRRATITLTESAISHLALLADVCDVAKSKLIRFLIEHHFNLSPEQRKQKEKSIIVE